jgi:hypothetical protein
MHGIDTGTCSAVLDVVRPVDVKQLDVPMTPSKLWYAMQEAKRYV